MKSLPDIQQLINERAERRLKQHLDDMRSKIISISVLNITDSNFPKISFKDKSIQPYWFFNDGDGTFYEALYNYWLPIYKNREAQNFLAEVERLKSDVNDLMNVTHENDY